MEPAENQSYSSSHHVFENICFCSNVTGVIWELYPTVVSVFPTTEGYSASCKDKALQNWGWTLTGTSWRNQQKRQQLGSENDPQKSTRSWDDEEAERRNQTVGDRKHRTGIRIRTPLRRVVVQRQTRVSFWWQQLPEAFADPIFSFIWIFAAPGTEDMGGVL